VHCAICGILKTKPDVSIRGNFSTPNNWHSMQISLNLRNATDLALCIKGLAIEIPKVERLSLGEPVATHLAVARPKP
jgi:hypothetical protein